MASTKTGVIITADASDLTAKLSKAMKELGAYYDQYGRLTNAAGRYIGSLSRADVELGHYIDSLGRTRDAQGNLVDGLTRAQKALRMYIDEQGNLRSAEGLIVSVSKDRLATLSAETRATIENQQAANAAAVAKKQAQSESYQAQIRLCEEKIKVLAELAKAENRPHTGEEQQRIEALEAEIKKVKELKEALDQATAATIEQLNASTQNTLDQAPANNPNNNLDQTLSQMAIIQSQVAILLKISDHGQKKVDAVTHSLILMQRAAAYSLATFSLVNQVVRAYEALRAATNAATAAELVRQAVSRNASALMITAIIAATTLYVKLISYAVDYLATIRKIVDAEDKHAVAMARLKKNGREEGDPGRLNKFAENSAWFMPSPLALAAPLLSPSFDEQQRRNRKNLGLQMDAGVESASVKQSDQFAQMRNNMSSQEMTNRDLRSTRDLSGAVSTMTSLSGLIMAYQAHKKLKEGEEKLKEMQESYAKQWGELVAQNLPMSEAEKYHDTLAVFDENIAMMKRQYKEDPSESGKAALANAMKARANYEKRGAEDMRKNYGLPDVRTPAEKYAKSLKDMAEYYAALPEPTGPDEQEELRRRQEEQAKTHAAMTEELRRSMGLPDVRTPAEKYAEAMKNAADYYAALPEPTGPDEQEELRRRQEEQAKTHTALREELQRQLGFPDLKTPGKKLAETLARIRENAEELDWTPEQTNKQIGKAQEDFAKDIGLTEKETPIDVYRRQEAQIIEQYKIGSAERARLLNLANEDLKKNLGFADIKTPAEQYAETLRNLALLESKGAIAGEQLNLQREKAARELEQSARSYYNIDKYVPHVPDTSEIQNQLRRWAEAVRLGYMSQSEMNMAQRRYAEDIKKQTYNKYGIGDLMEEIKSPAEKYMERMKDIQAAYQDKVIDFGTAQQLEAKLREKLNQNQNESTKGERLAKSMNYGSQDLYSAMVKQSNTYQSKVTSGIGQVVGELQTSRNEMTGQLASLNSNLGNLGVL